MTKGRFQIFSLLLFVLTQFLLLSCGTDKAPQLKYGKWREVISRLTVDEKIAFLFTPTVDGGVWGMPRLGIKSTVMGESMLYLIMCFTPFRYLMPDLMKLV